MGVAALISWFVTAFVGLYLLAVWLIENDPQWGDQHSPCLGGEHL